MDMEFQLKPALCLDFDGTIRKSKSGATFIENENDIVLMDGIEEAIWFFKNKGYLIFGVSNQGGVAHGFKTPSQIMKEVEVTIGLFNKNPFDIVKACLHEKNGNVEPFCHRSLLRKPDVGMLALMELESFEYGFIVDWDNSLFVGDRPEDEQCAKNAGIRFAHIDEFLSNGQMFLS